MNSSEHLRDLVARFEMLFAGRALPKQMKLSFAIVDLGTSLTIDTSKGLAFSYAWQKDADIAAVTNAITLVDLLAGQFEPTAPKPEHLFVWDAAPQAWKRLMDALFGGVSPVGVRMSGVLFT